MLLLGYGQARGCGMRRRASVPVPTEYDEQCAVVDWFDRYAPTKGFDARLLACSANGAILGGDGRLRAIQMERLKRMGLRTGDPDLFLRIPRPPFAGFALEMKRLNWTPPNSGERKLHYDNQLSMLNMLSVQSYHVGIYAGADAAIAAIKAYIRQ